MEVIKITDIEGIKIGHAENLDGVTGCTVILCEEGATAGVDVRGGAPGTRETDLLNPINMIDKIHGVLLTGGSAFGLDAAGGVMEYLEKKGVGFDIGVTKVPIVCGAALFDLLIGDYKIRPNKDMGYKACVNANNREVQEGNVGAGTGATIGKILGPEYAMKGGLGIYTVKVGELMIGAVVAVNCLGNVVDSENGKVIGGVLEEDRTSFRSTEDIMISQYNNKKKIFNGNTTIGAVVTNAKLSKSEANKVAAMAHNGFARSIYPVHTMHDGDTIFTMATGKIEADINVVGLMAAKVIEKAVVRGIKNSYEIGGYKCYKDLQKV